MAARRPPRACFLGAALALGLASRPGAASPQDVFGFGPRSGAMGQTGTAVGEGYETVYANPALLTLSRERELTVGFLGATFDLNARTRVSYAPLQGSVIGAVLPVPFGGALAHRITLGLAFFTPFNLVVRARALYPETPQFPIADRTQSVAVQAGLGIDVGHGLRIGGGFSALAALTGTVDVGTDATGRIGTVVGDTLVASYGPIVGVTYDLGESYRVGLAFRGELVARFQVVINAKDLGDIVVPPIHLSGIAQYDPAELTLEVARVKGPWKVAASLTYKRWSAYPGNLDATVQCPTTDPTTGMPFTDPCTPLVPAPTRYSDTVSPRVGVERVIAAAPAVGMRLRGGALYDPSPVPEQTATSNSYDSGRLAITLGYGLSLAAPLPPIDLDVFGQLHWLTPRTNTKAPDLPADNAGAPSVRTSGTITAGGMTLGVRF